MPQDTLSQETATKKIYIETLGCQMNFNDSEVMMGMLANKGFEPTDIKEEADVLVVNTCQIRGSAEDKAYSRLGYFQKMKKKNPSLKIAMAGCVAQQAKDSVFQRMQGVDIVFGTQNIHELPSLLERAYQGETKILAADRQKPRNTYDYFEDITPVRDSDISAWVSIIEGCDYFCTYCVVPYTRGRQISRHPDSVIEEVTKLGQWGFKEITLLGQTVDSYGKDFDEDSKAKGYTLANLLRALNEIEGIERIRFMTSHPLDLSDDIIDAVATLPKVCENIHIPMQAGDDDMLERMRRGYTSEEYFTLVNKLYERIPGVAVTGDYIVGFPGETDEQYQNTVKSVRRSGIDMANTAMYSAREQTPAAHWEAKGEEVSSSLKKERLLELNVVIGEQSARINQTYVDNVVEVLVEGKSKRNPDRLTGRTRTNKVVNFETTMSDDDLVGKFARIHIQGSLPFSLSGVHVSNDTALSDKSEYGYASLMATTAAN